MRFLVSLKTLSPLAIAVSRATGNQVGSLSYIPGTVWRGAVARALMDRNGHVQPEHNPAFSTVFLQELVRFTDLRPAGARSWPMSARCCKLHAADHRVLDLLLATGRGWKLPVECSHPTPDGECTAKLKAPDGYFQWQSGRPRDFEVRRRITAHTAIDGSTLRVRSEQFFTTDVLERGQMFTGELIAKPAAEEAVRWAVGAGQHRLVIGRGATRGQGHAELRLVPAGDTSLPKQEAQFLERIKKLNALYAIPGTVAFTCTLLSPCMVYDRWLLSRSYLLPGDIAEAAGEPGALTDFELNAWYSRLAVLSGWNAQAGLPKADTSAIQAGSAFLFTRRIQDDAAREEECRRLAGVLVKAAAGVGERWQEGFGEASFCDPFHYEQRIDSPGTDA